MVDMICQLAYELLMSVWSIYNIMLHVIYIKYIYYVYYNKSRIFVPVHSPRDWADNSARGRYTKICNPIDQILPLLYFLLFLYTVWHAFSRQVNTTSKTFPVSSETAATRPSRAVQPRQFHEQSKFASTSTTFSTNSWSAQSARLPGWNQPQLGLFLSLQLVLCVYPKYIDQHF